MLMVENAFTPHSIETDSELYGIRKDVFYGALQTIINGGNVLITGIRGIGKSSLQYQLQQLLKHNEILLTRLEMSSKDIPFFHTFAYICSKDEDIAVILGKLLKQIEEECIDKKKSNYQINEIYAKFNAKFIETGITASPVDSTGQETLAVGFAEAISQIRNEYTKDSIHINVAIDEIDRLAENSGIANVFKIVSEQLTNIYGKEHILSFIIAGQNNVFGVLNEQHPSFYRLVSHYQLEALDEYITFDIFNDCIHKMNMDIEQVGLDLLIRLSGGHPDLIHSLGEAAVNAMLKRHNETDRGKRLLITEYDCIEGIFSVLAENAPRYQEIWRVLSTVEQDIIYVMAYSKEEESRSQFSFESPQWNHNNIIQGCLDTYDTLTEDQIKEGLNKLCDKQILKHFLGNYESTYSFRDELFRVYISKK